MNTKTATVFLDDFLDFETDTDLAVNDEKMDAAERALRVRINARAEMERRIDERKAREAWVKARQKARVHACYRRLACCALAAVAACILARIGAVSPVIAMIVSIAAMARIIPELYWIARKAIRFWTKKEGKHRA